MENFPEEFWYVQFQIYTKFTDNHFGKGGKIKDLKLIFLITPSKNLSQGIFAVVYIKKLLETANSNAMNFHVTEA